MQVLKMNNLESRIKHRRGLDIIVHGYNDVQGINTSSVDGFVESYRGGSIVLWEMPNVNGLSDLLKRSKKVSYASFRDYFKHLPPVLCEQLYYINKQAKEVLPIGGSMNSDPLNNYRITYNILWTINSYKLRDKLVDINVGYGHLDFIAYVLKKLNFNVSQEVHTVNEPVCDWSKESLFKGLLWVTPKRVMNRLDKLIKKSSYLDTELVNQQYTV